MLALSFYVFKYPGESILGLAIAVGVGTLIAGTNKLMLDIAGRKELKGWGWFVAGGIAEILIGWFLLSNPGATSGALTLAIPLIIGFWAIFDGSTQFFTSFEAKKEGERYWWISMIGGIAMALLGFYIMLTVNPASGALTVVFLLAFTFALSGITSIFSGFSLRKINKEAKELDLNAA